MTDVTALGVDWYRRGWVGVLLAESAPPAVLVDPDLAALIARAGDVACVGVDMPIGLPARGERTADLMARSCIGRRRSSVFMTPPARVLAAATYGEANAIAVALNRGKKISRQAWALRDNIAVVAAVAARDTRVIEVHPEVSFRTMAGAELAHSKGTWNGQMLRRRALAGEGFVIADELAEAGDVPVADILDAAAVAWSARRFARGEAGSFPEDVLAGQREVIWY